MIPQNNVGVNSIDHATQNEERAVWGDDNEAIGRVECCSDDDNTCSRKDNNNVCFGFENDVYQLFTYDEAVALCESQSRRLCNKEETSEIGGRCCNKGCTGDYPLTWTSEMMPSVPVQYSEVKLSLPNLNGAAVTAVTVEGITVVPNGYARMNPVMADFEGSHVETLKRENLPGFGPAACAKRCDELAMACNSFVFCASECKLTDNHAVATSNDLRHHRRHHDDDGNDNDHPSSSSCWIYVKTDPGAWELYVDASSETPPSSTSSTLLDSTHKWEQPCPGRASDGTFMPRDDWELANADALTDLNSGVQLSAREQAFASLESAFDSHLLLTEGYTVFWTLDVDTGIISMALYCTLCKGWLGLGFPMKDKGNANGAMVTSHAIIATECPGDGPPVIGEYELTQYHISGVNKLAPDQQTLTELSCNVDSTGQTFFFKRSKRTEAFKIPVNEATGEKVIWAVGESTTLAQHRTLADIAIPSAGDEESEKADELSNALKDLELEQQQAGMGSVYWPVPAFLNADSGGGGGGGNEDACTTVCQISNMQRRGIRRSGFP